MREATTPTASHSTSEMPMPRGYSEVLANGTPMASRPGRRRRRGSVPSSRSPVRRTGRARRRRPRPGRPARSGRELGRVGGSATGTTAVLRRRDRPWVTGGGTPVLAERPARPQSLRCRHGHVRMVGRGRSGRVRAGVVGSPQVSRPWPSSLPWSCRLGAWRRSPVEVLALAVAAAAATRGGRSVPGSP